MSDKKISAPKQPVPSSRERDMRRDPVFMEFFEFCSPYTMTTIERLYSIYTAVQYVAKNNILGDIVECGVWKGGSMMMASLTSRSLNEDARRFFLFDTFEGMPKPTSVDFKFDGMSALKKWNEGKSKGEKWNFSSLTDVKNAMLQTRVSDERIFLIKGLVEETLPCAEIRRISILRLDTDFYSSTLHGLRHLYPLLSKGGILIIDDYGTWAGAQKAVDQFFKEMGITMLLNRVDAGGRIGVKLED